LLLANVYLAIEKIQMTLDHFFQLSTGILVLFCLVVGKYWLTPCDRWDFIGFWAFSAFFILFAAMRPLGVGVDDLTYATEQFNRACSTLFCHKWIQGDRDQAWYSLVGLLKSIAPFPRVQLLLVASGLGFKLWVISKLTQHRSLALLVYAACFYIIHDIAALRVSLSISVYLGAFYLLIQHRLLCGGLALVVNGLFHKQAFVAPFLYLGRWIPWSRRGTLFLLVPMGFLMLGIYPGDAIFKWAMSLPRGPDVINALFGASYVAGKLAGVYDEVRTWPVVVPPTILLATWLIRDLDPKSLLFKYSATSLLLAVLFLWGYAVIPEVQLRFWHFFLVPIVFIVGNARLNRLKLAAILLLAGIYIVKYTTLHDLLLDQRTLSTTVQPGGTVGFFTEGTPEGDQARNFALGVEAEVRAAPKEGFRFDRWSGDCVGTEPVCILEMTQDRQTEAHFIQTAKVMLESSGPGTVQSHQAGPPCTPNCVWTLDVGTELKMDAVAAAGAHFGGWEGACTGLELSCFVRVSQDASLRARFVQEVPITLTHTGAGGLSIEAPGVTACPEECSLTMDAGTRVRVTPVPGEGQKFLGWTSGCSGVTPVCEVEAQTPMTVTARFGPVVSLSLSRVGEGQIIGQAIPPGCGNPCSVEFEAETSMTLLPKPASGFGFAGWSGACEGQKQCSLRLNRSETVEARFIPLKAYPIKVVATAGGEVSSEPGGIHCGHDPATACQGQFAEITLTASPKPGYRFRGWSGCEAQALPMCHLRLRHATEVMARFEKIPPVQAILEIEGAGDILSENGTNLCAEPKRHCTLAVESGEELLLKAVPARGHIFMGWVGACGSREPECRVRATGAFGVKALFE
jgi:EpsG family/Divergent InlB B-repeat domain